MSTTADDYTITFHDPLEDSDEVIAERVAYTNLMHREILPDDPPIDLAQSIAAIRAAPKRIRRMSFRVRDAEGALVANATTSIDPDDDNPDILWAGINVLPPHRRRGLGTRLLAELVGLAEQEGKTRIVGNTFDEVEAGAAFATAIGAESKQAVHTNHLPMEDVNRTQLEGWVADAPTRAADYELIGWDGSVPEEHMANWLDLIVVMNTAPRDDLEMEDFTVTAEEIRESEKVSDAMGREHWTLVARHRDTGAWAGFHDVTWDPNEPMFVYVGATGVRPEHRGHALGKWLKAAMTLRIMDERPDVTNVRTGNADSNDAMLGINKEMGYRPLLAQKIWELRVEDAASLLRGRVGSSR
jgi:GNAT superfamily N-acetyltransferase